MSVMVSVLCTAYNHEKYIRKALDSFVMQKTDFQFEVIVNDDASTDHTPDILREYALKYPELIIPVYQKENQYSKGISITRRILLPMARGKYFALCEGDDYWTDPLKLQKQVDYMEAHPDCTLCIHNGIKVKENGDKLSNYIVSQKERDILTDEVILGGGDFCPTNSIFAPMTLTRNLPSYFNTMTLDYIWQIYLTSSGKAHCLADKMSAYRVAAQGSWTANFRKRSADSLMSLWDRMIQVLTEIDASTEYKFNDPIMEVINCYRINQSFLTLDSKGLRDSELRSSVKHLYFKKRMRAYLLMYFPSAYRVVAHKVGWPHF